MAPGLHGVYSNPPSEELDFGNLEAPTSVHTLLSLRACRQTLSDPVVDSTSEKGNLYQFPSTLTLR